MVVPPTPPPKNSAWVWHATANQTKLSPTAPTAWIINESAGTLQMQALLGEQSNTENTHTHTHRPSRNQTLCTIMVTVKY